MHADTNTETDPASAEPARGTRVVGLADLLDAKRRIDGAIRQTPCLLSRPLSALTGCMVHAKLEFLQRTGSFKERGARNALASLPPEQARRGVIAASAGNHALGLAWHGRALKIPVTLVMPASAPTVKVSGCKALGAKVVLHGNTFDESNRYARELQERDRLTPIHPFDHASVIAGQGTVALELLEQLHGFDAVLAPVGGGGLLAGVAAALRPLLQRVKIIGVEPENAPSFSTAARKGFPIQVKTKPSLADGLSVSQAGDLTFRTASRLIDEVVTVSEAELAAAIRQLHHQERWKVEGAGAAPLAALLSGKLPELRGKRVVLLLTGGNIDPQIHTRVVGG